MRFECKWKRAQFPKGSSVIKFERMEQPAGVDKNGKPIFFGVFDSGNAETLKSLPGETTESLDTWIQGRRQFKEGVPGKLGIWLEKDRLGKVIVGHQQDGVLKYLSGLGQKALRMILAAAKVAYPPAATDAELAVLASNLTANQMGFKETATTDGGPQTGEDKPAETGTSTAADTADKATAVANSESNVGVNPEAENAAKAAKKKK